MAERVNKFLLLLVISLTVRGLFIFCFPHCYSFDLHAWDSVGEILLAGGNPYNMTGWLNWPPVWMQLIFCFKKFSLLTHMPFVDVVRGFLILVESASMLLLYVMAIQFTKFRKITTLVMAGIVLNPISILQVCQQCNFDVLVGFWILLAIYMLLRFHQQHESRFWLFACFALGMGAVTKTVPLSLWPLLLPSARKLKLTEQILGGALLLTPIVLGMSIIYVLGPHDIETKVLGYRSMGGDFGFTGLFTYWRADHLLTIWPDVFLFIFGIGWFSLCVRLWSKETIDVQEIIAIATVILVAIPALGPGYGPTYVYWFLPLLVLMYAQAERKLKVFLLVFYGIATATYLIDYGFNYNSYGAFFLDIIQNESTLRFTKKLSSGTSETFVRLPLWIFYLAFVTILWVKIGRKMRGNLKVAAPSSQIVKSPGDQSKLF